MLRLIGILLIIMVLTACQPVAEEIPFVMHPLVVADYTQDFETHELATNQSSVELYPAPIVDRYPADGVRGIYLTAYAAADEGLSAHAFSLLEQSALNAVVIDYKDDWGHIASAHTSDDEQLEQATRALYDAVSINQRFHEAGAYTIARIVCFKDSYLAQQAPARALQNQDGSLWHNASGDAYLNPFDQTNWDYLVAAALEAAKAGFDEIQLDYVRFPENFNALSQSIKLEQGEYATLDLSEEAKRSRVISDFIGYLRERLTDYPVRLGVDIFGYVTMVEDDGNVGQNFLQIAQQVDVISSMIYPSHWNDGAFGAAKPDKEPARVVSGYIARELELLSSLESPPITRPWLQAFTASYLGSGNFIPYTAKEVEAQIEALRQAGVPEYLLWDPSNHYFEQANY